MSGFLDEETGPAKRFCRDPVLHLADPNLCYTVFCQAEMASSNGTDNKVSIVNGGQILDSLDECALGMGLDIDVPGHARSIACSGFPTGKEPGVRISG